MTIEPSSFLRIALRSDAVTSLVTGLVLCLATAPLATRFGLAPSLLLSAGLVCLAYGTMAWSWGGRPRLRSPGVMGIVIGNFLWSVVALLLLLGVGASPTPSGQVHLALHVLLPSAFGVLEWIGLRRSLPAMRPVTA